MNQPNHKPDFAKAIAPWVRGKQIAVYLRGREKPMTGLTVCAVYPSVLVARWESSTHLINNEAIVTIRFAPDCDPIRDRNHPLHANVSLPRDTDSRPPPAKDYPKPSEPAANAPERDHGFIAGRELMPDVLAKLGKSLQTPQQRPPRQPSSHARSPQRVKTPASQLQDSHDEKK